MMGYLLFHHLANVIPSGFFFFSLPLSEFLIHFRGFLEMSDDFWLSVHI